MFPCGRGEGLGGGTGGWVDVLGGGLRRHLDDPGLVDDAGAAVALLHDADDPRLVTLAVLRGLDLCTEPSGLLPGETDQQTS